MVGVDYIVQKMMTNLPNESIEEDPSHGAPTHLPPFPPIHNEIITSAFERISMLTL
jgi:hypothetical protein